MDRYSRQKTVHANGKGVSSPVIKSEKNNAAKAAAQRLAHVMASQSPSNNGDGSHRFRSRSASPSANKGYAKSIANAEARTARSPSPAVRKNMNGHISTPSTSTAHMCTSPRRSPKALTNRASGKQIPPSPRAQSNAASVKQIPPSPRAQSIAASLKQRPPKPPLQVIADVQKEKRYSAHPQHVKFRESDKLWKAATLHDEIDLLKEEKEKLLYKIRLAEQKFKEQEVRARECEKQG